jgi:hypothetical protein
MGPSSEKPESYTAELVVLAGYIFFFCLAVILYFIFLISFTRNLQKSPSQINSFATNLPPQTPIPSIPLNYEPGSLPIFREDFDNNQIGWTGDPDLASREFKDGKLYIESLDENSYALTSCSKCPILREPYIFTVELSTDQLTDGGFGVVFALQYTRDYFYLFRINLESKKYFLSRYYEDNWSRRMTGIADQIQPYPAVNKLSIYVNKSMVEFYINGKLIDTYQDAGTSFQSGQVGLYVNDTGFKLIADNLIIDKIEGK